MTTAPTTDENHVLGYPVHPACALLPLMSEDSLAEMAYDIKVNGLTRPVVLNDGKLLDGRNRLLACEMAGVEPDFVEFEGEDPVAWVLSLNFHRRHLTETQKALVGARAERVLLARANALAPSTVAPAEDGAETPTEDTAMGEGADSPSQVAKKVRRSAAALVNVSERAIAKGKKLIDRAVPELVYAVERGTVPFAAATTVAELEPPKQREVMAEGPEMVRAEAKRMQAERRAGRPPSVAKALGILDDVCPDYIIEKTREGRFIFKASIIDGEEERPIEVEAFTLKDLLAQACQDLAPMMGEQSDDV